VPGTTNVNFTAQSMVIAIAIINHRVQLTFVWPSGSYQVQAATNLTSPILWQTLATATTGTNGILLYSDPTPANLPSRFYRIRSSSGP
jgi:hypothetical protein